MNVEEMLAKTVSVQHRQTINEALIHSLEQYLENDSGDAPKQLMVRDPCMAPVVSSAALELVLDELYESNELLSQELVELNARDTHERPERYQDIPGPAADDPDGSAEAEAEGQ